jgi:hypothetical protein
VIWPPFLSALVSCIALTLAWLQLQTVTRQPSPGLRARLPRLARTPSVDRVMVAALETDAESWEGRLVRELAAAEDEVGRIDAASESVSELALRYGARSKWAWSALRLQVLGGVLAASLAVAQQERAGATLALLIAAIGAIIVHMLGRAASEREREQRSNADKLVGLLLPSVHKGERTRASRNSPSRRRS